ncbi:MAG: DUF4625 domain-containing protein [Bacteroidales bacterium]|nr:DUF4625 domain-containing protein [Bacteroidales bacterium]
MKKFGILSILSIAFAFTFTACDKDDDVDTVNPVIELDEPEDGDELLIGAGVHFECDFSDNVMLGSYMIEIHNNFDGHSHKANKSEEALEPFFFKKSYDLTGLRNAHEHHHDIVIPENATPGNYHLVVYCTDAAGNQSLVAREIVLSHDAEEHHHHHDGDDDDDDED